MNDVMLAPATADALGALHRAGTLTSDAYRRALQLTLGTPASSRWRPFLSRGSLILGACLLLAGVIYFFAFNWDAMPRLLRFGVLEAGIVGTGLLAMIRPASTTRSVALAFAAVLLGPLLAVYGQEYQTGADPWELFAAWTVLALPFAIVARWTPLWMLLGVLANVALWRWFDERGFDASATAELLSYWGLNAAICAAFAFTARGRWGARLFAAAAVLPLFLFVVQWAAFDSLFFNEARHWPAAILGAAAASVLVLLAALRRDLFMLSLGACGALTLVAAHAWQGLSGSLRPDDFGYLPMAALLIAGVGLAVWLLKKAQRAGVRT